ncbi:hypothetical protein ANCCAN_06593 [Ancylostoma caninum]|uniref:Cysteine rich repeat-containing domain protein n=1 Tax=Ancylostoma caninum TaxID=29170 RepID=A0A368GWB5_ANCCA|nr:hypothetical protein ANCCAN_06593 [Ancylostoma caninum]
MFASTCPSSCRRTCSQSCVPQQQIPIRVVMPKFASADQCFPMCQQSCGSTCGAMFSATTCTVPCKQSCEQRCARLTSINTREQIAVEAAVVDQCSAACRPKCAPQCIQDQQLLANQPFLSPAAAGPLPQLLYGQSSMTTGPVATELAQPPLPFTGESSVISGSVFGGEAQPLPLLPAQPASTSGSIAAEEPLTQQTVTDHQPTTPGEMSTASTSSPSLDQASTAQPRLAIQEGLEIPIVAMPEPSQPEQLLASNPPSLPGASEGTGVTEQTYLLFGYPELATAGPQSMQGQASGATPAVPIYLLVGQPGLATRTPQVQQELAGQLSPNAAQSSVPTYLLVGQPELATLAPQRQQGSAGQLIPSPVPLVTTTAQPAFSRATPGPKPPVAGQPKLDSGAAQQPTPDSDAFQPECTAECMPTCDLKFTKASHLITVAHTCSLLYIELAVQNTLKTPTQSLPEAFAHVCK